MAALVIAALVLLFLAWKVAKLAALVALVSLAVCAWLTASIALAIGRGVGFGLARGH